MTRLYLAVIDAPQYRETFKLWDFAARPVNFLVSFAHLGAWDRKGSRADLLPAARRMLDSGAYTAWTQGKTVDLAALLREAAAPMWDEAVALDVIGDGRASRDNAFAMKAAGSKAFPVFHYGDDFGILAEYCAAFPKVGISCRFGEAEKDSVRWLDACFAKAYPHNFHSFGWVKADVLRRYPFASADASSWNAAGMYGRWRAFGNANLRTVGKRAFDLRAEIDVFWELGQELASRWAREAPKWQAAAARVTR
jgi:hypothetical protein